MAKKKRSQAPVKKQSPVAVSQEENAQQVFEHYHEIAHKLQRSTNRQQAEAALTEMHNVPEAAQMRR